MYASFTDADRRLNALTKSHIGLTARAQRRIKWDDILSTDAPPHFQHSSVRYLLFSELHRQVGRAMWLHNERVSSSEPVDKKLEPSAAKVNMKTIIRNRWATMR